MANKLRKIETQKAVYQLHTGNHLRATDIDNLEEFDALVLETGFETYENCTLRELIDFISYSKLVSDNVHLKSPRPIFFVDLPANPRLNRAGAVGYVVGNFLGAFSFTIPSLISFSYFGLSPQTIVSLMPTISLFLSFARPATDVYGISAYSSLSNFYTSGGFRSAVSARKLEEFIAPMTGARKKSRPNILIDFGAAHSDIEPYLKHRRLRKAVESVGKMLPWCSRMRDMSYFNTVAELQNPGNVNEPYDQKIFKRGMTNYRSRNYEMIFYKM